ncbi:phenoloxidase-activating factor 1-like isoform X2 [Onthophagus taurus]
MEFDKEKYCGGVLINNLYVLTSGHCVDELKLNFKLKLNTHNRFSSNQIILNQKNIIRHPNYAKESTNNIINDLALIKLETPINFEDKIYPICLPHPSSDYTRKIGSILGWGLNENATTSNVLKRGEVQIMSEDYCLKSMVGKFYHESMLCGFSNSSDACQGDSGGPLFYQNSDGQHELIGLISWGFLCGTEMPGIYTKIAHFMDWIEKNTEDAGYCNV